MAFQTTSCTMDERHVGAPNSVCQICTTNDEVLLRVTTNALVLYMPLMLIFWSCPGGICHHLASKFHQSIILQHQNIKWLTDVAVIKTDLARDLWIPCHMRIFVCSKNNKTASCIPQLISFFTYYRSLDGERQICLLVLFPIGGVLLTLFLRFYDFSQFKIKKTITNFSNFKFNKNLNLLWISLCYCLKADD